VKEEQLWGGRYVLAQEAGVFPLSMDTMALGDFVTLKPGDSVWDLGCGSGVLALLLAGQGTAFSYVGVDVSPEACRLARENLGRNGLSGTILEGDLRAPEGWMSPGKASLVVTNPPYFPPEGGKPGTLARTGCTLAEICAGAGRLLKNGGRLAMVYPAAQLDALFSAMRGAGITPKVLRLVAHATEKPPKLALVQGVKQGKPGLTLLPNLNWYHPDGTPTADYRRIYHITDTPAQGEA
jgi:tRNA1(Val) A37 N6-methylase TrmN6